MALSRTRSARIFSACESLESRQLFSAFFVAPGGSDSGPGSAAHPFATLQQAADTVQPGDTVDIKPGNYAGFFQTTSGTQAQPIVFSAEPGTVVNKNNPDTSDGIDLEGASYVTVQGFTVVPGNNVTMRSGIRSVSNTGAVIANNTVTGVSWWGILTGFSENVLIENNTVSNTQIQHGIYVGNSADNPQIIGNTVYGNRYCGIQINADGNTTDTTLPKAQGSDGIITNALVEGNVIYDNAAGGGAAINFDGVQNSTIANNLIYSGERNGIALYDIDGSGPSMNDIIVNNTITQNNNNGQTGYAAISILNGSSGAQIYNNILSSQENTLSIDRNSQGRLQCDFNIVGSSGFDPTGESYSNNISLSEWQNLGYDQHSTLISNIDGLFVNDAAGNFHLAAHSAAIGAGASIDAPATDLDGNARPGSGGAYDIGAYQTQSGTPAPALPSVPTNLSATASTNRGQIDLSWSDPAKDETGFIILRSTGGGAFKQAAVISGTNTSYSDKGLADSTTFSYEVIATNSAGSSVASGSAGATTITPAPAPPALPATPTSLVAQSVGTSSVTLNWADPAGDETGFIVDRSINGGAFSLDTTLSGTNTSYTETGLSAGTTYSYYVVATNVAGSSGNSNTSSATTDSTPPQLPASPANVTAQIAGANAVTAAWSDPAGDATGYLVQRSDAGGAFATVDTITDASITSFTDQGLTTGVAYGYQVIATNAAGNSQPSQDPTVTLPTPTTARPGTPTNLNATPDNGNIALTWQDPAQDASGYIIQRHTDITAFQTIGTLQTGTPGYIDQTALPGVNYTYRIIATNSAGNSRSSAIDTAMLPKSPQGAPARPTALAASAVSLGEIDLKWVNHADNATGVQVLRRRWGTDYTIIDVVPASQNFYDDTSVQAGAGYYYRVLAIAPTGQSPVSNRVSIRALTAPTSATSTMAPSLVLASELDLTAVLG